MRNNAIPAELFRRLQSGEVTVADEPEGFIEKRIAKMMDHDMWLVLRTDKDETYRLRHLLLFSSLEDAKEIGSKNAALEITSCEAAPAEPEDEEGYNLTIEFGNLKSCLFHSTSKELPAILTVLTAFNQALK